MPGEHFSHEEKFDMLTCYILCHKNSVNAEIRYRNEFPDRRQPDKSIFLKLARNLKEYGSFKKPLISRKKNRTKKTKIMFYKQLLKTLKYRLGKSKKIPE